MTSKMVKILVIVLGLLNMLLLSCVQDGQGAGGKQEISVRLPDDIQYENVEGLSVGEIFRRSFKKRFSDTIELNSAELAKVAVPINFEGAHIATIWWNDFVPFEGEWAEPDWIYWDDPAISWSDAIEAAEESPWMEVLTNSKLKRVGDEVEAEIRVREGQTDVHIIFFNRFVPVRHYTNTYYYNCDDGDDGWLEALPVFQGGTPGAEFCQQSVPACGAYMGWETPELCETTLTNNCAVTSQVGAYFECINANCDPNDCQGFNTCMYELCYDTCN